MSKTRNPGYIIGLLFPVTAVLAALALLAGCTTSSAGTASAATVATIQRGTITLNITTAGNLKYSVTAEPAFEMAGNVTQLLIEEGQTVSKGQVLAVSVAAAVGLFFGFYPAWHASRLSPIQALRTTE